eukprot:gene8863-16479_t
MSLKSEEKKAGGDSTLVKELMSELENSKKEASQLKELNGVLVKKSNERERAFKLEKDQCKMECRKKWLRNSYRAAGNAQNMAATAESKFREMADEIQEATTRAKTTEKRQTSLNHVLTRLLNHWQMLRSKSKSQSRKRCLLVSLKEKDQTLKWQLRENKQMRYELTFKT